MRFLNTRLKKVIFWILTVIIVFIVLVIAFISPLTRWAIEKYDIKYTGREITLDRVYVNPFTGYVYLKNLQIREADSDSLFFSTSSISTNLEMLKLFSKTYEISHLTISDPMIKIVQNKKEFNFNDLIEKFSSKDTLVKKEPNEPVHFNLLNVEIKNGTFYYIEKSIPVFYFIKEVNIETKGKRWDIDTMDFKFSLASGIGSGTMRGTMKLNAVSTDYRLVTVADKFDLSVLEQYVRDIANYGRVRGNLDADIVAEGNFKNAQDLNAKGFVAVNEFHIGKSLNEDYTSFKKLSVAITQLSPLNKKYFFDSISLVKPYFKYELYDHLNNLQYMFGKKGEKVEQSKGQSQKTNILFQIGSYIELLAKNFFKSDYKVKRLAIYDADIRYNDYTLKEKFSAAVCPLSIFADSIERSEKWVNLKLRTKLKPYGDMGLDVSINPRDSSDFNFKFYLKKVPMAMFNPYFISYTSFPLDRGIIEVKGDWTVRNGVINSKNNLLIIDPRINNRQRRNGAKWLPLRFIMFFVRDRGNVIDYEVPIKGDLKDPKFKLKDVIFDVLENIFVKPVTAPYRTEVKNVENAIEKTLTLKWATRSATFSNPQEKFLKRIADFLKENPAQTITIHPEFYIEKEKEYILFYEAKKMFYLAKYSRKLSSLKEGDSTKIEKLSIKDSSFTKFLNEKTDRALHTTQEKCRMLLGDKKVNRKLKELNNARKKVFLSFFAEDGLDKRIRVGSIRDTIPFNGFSLYRVIYKGELPEELVEAYNKIEKLDENSPRDKFKVERKKNRALLDVK